MPTDVIKGRWSSIKVVNQRDRLGLDRNGVVQIVEVDEQTGEITTGYYTDVDTLERVDLDGHVRFVGTGVYSLSLNHPDPDVPLDTLYYEGQIVISDDGIIIVVGNFRTEHGSDPVDNSTAKTQVLVDAQEEGVWVLTKP